MASVRPIGSPRPISSSAFSLSAFEAAKIALMSGFGLFTHPDAPQIFLYESQQPVEAAGQGISVDLQVLPEAEEPTGGMHFVVVHV